MQDLLSLVYLLFALGAAHVAQAYDNSRSDNVRYPQPLLLGLLPTTVILDCRVCLCSLN